MSLSWIKHQWRLPSGLAWTTDTGPAICTFAGKLHMVWKVAGTSAIKHSSFDGCAWTAAATIPGAQTTTVPSLASATIGGTTRLYMAWRHETDQFQSYCWYDVIIGTWSAPQPIPGTASSHGPSLAAFSGKLYAAWKGIDADTTLWRSNFDGTSWAPQQQFPPSFTSAASPSLCVFESRLYMFWKWSAAMQMSRTSTANGINWGAATPFPTTLTTRTGPSAAAPGTDSFMYLFWDEPTNQVRYSATANGGQWGFGDLSNYEESIPSPCATSTRPSAAIWNGIVWVAWKDAVDQRIWWTRANY